MRLCLKRDADALRLMTRWKVYWTWDDDLMKNWDIWTMQKNISIYWGTIRRSDIRLRWQRYTCTIDSPYLNSFHKPSDLNNTSSATRLERHYLPERALWAISYPTHIIATPCGNARIWT